MQESPPLDKTRHPEKPGPAPAALDAGLHYHFLGIGGMGMSALAEVMQRRGYRVSGSDARDSATLARLAALGISVAVGHRPELLQGIDAVVFTPALLPEHPIWKDVARRGLARLSRAQALGALAAGGRTLAVAGTHGKTTCTAALACVLTSAGWDPTALVGGEIPQFGGATARVGGSRWMVVEADESDGGFTHLSPQAAILTNIEAEHLDHHGTLAAVAASFAAFLKKLPPEGLLVYCADEPLAARLAADAGCEAVSYGFSPAAELQVAAQAAGGGRTRITLAGGGRREQFSSALFGAHNALNLAAAYALAVGIGVPRAAVLEGLAGFGGVARRQQYLGDLGDCRVFDDYAHHPTEVRATLTALLERFGEPLTVVFQPHLYTRTAYFAAEFAEALRPATRIFVADIFGAREEPVAGVTSDLILARLGGHGAAFALPPWREAALPGGALWHEPPQGVLVTMGAGDITGLGPLLLDQGGRR